MRRTSVARSAGEKGFSKKAPGISLWLRPYPEVKRMGML